MDQVDRTDHDERGPEVQAAPPPIVIVQRGRSSWGKESLLVILLLSATAYIFYQEYRGPSIIIRDEPRRSGRLVDSLAVAPVADGDVVLRASVDDDPPPDLAEEGDDPPVSRQEEGDRTDLGADPARIPPPDPPRIIDPPSEPIGAIAPEVLLATPPAPPRTPWDDQFAADPDRGVAFSIDDPDPFVDDPPRPTEDDPVRPGRATREIVWDLDRREGPLPASPDRVIPDRGVPREPRPIGHDERPAERPQPPTLAQRRHFHQCLVFAIRQHGLRAGPLIEGLCRDFETGLPPELDLIERQLGSNPVTPGSDLDRTITALRRFGASEAYLLDRLSEQMNRTIGARHGPRDRMEARVYAARKLLSIPLLDAIEDRR